MAEQRHYYPETGDAAYGPMAAPLAIKLLRRAGCKCDEPLPGLYHGHGPRCQICGIIREWKQRQPERKP